MSGGSLLLQLFRESFQTPDFFFGLEKQFSSKEMNVEWIGDKEKKLEKIQLHCRPSGFHLVEKETDVGSIDQMFVIQNQKSEIHSYASRACSSRRMLRMPRKGQARACSQPCSNIDDETI